MSDFSNLIEGIKMKVETLSVRNKELNERVNALESSLNEKDYLLEERDKIITNLTEENKMIGMAGSVGNTQQDSGAMKVKINELVKEIDKCIGLLNR